MPDPTAHLDRLRCEPDVVFTDTTHYTATYTVLADKSVHVVDLDMDTALTGPEILANIEGNVEETFE